MDFVQLKSNLSLGFLIIKNLFKNKIGLEHCLFSTMLLIREFVCHRNSINGNLMMKCKGIREVGRESETNRIMVEWEIVTKEKRRRYGMR